MAGDEEVASNEIDPVVASFLPFPVSTTECSLDEESVVLPVEVLPLLEVVDIDDVVIIVVIVVNAVVGDGTVSLTTMGVEAEATLPDNETTESSGVFFVTGVHFGDALHCGTKPGHFETSIIHLPTSKGVSGASERANGRASGPVL